MVFLAAGRPRVRLNYNEGKVINEYTIDTYGVFVVALEEATDAFLAGMVSGGCFGLGGIRSVV
jgi:hypothetical protein